MRYALLSLALLTGPFTFATDFRASAISQAVEMDDISTVKRMVEKGDISVNQRVDSSPYGHEGISILALAARAGALRVAQYLIENKADLNSKTSAGETAIMLAAFFDDTYWKGDGNFEKNDAIGRALIDAGAELNNGNYWCALSYAGYKGRHEIGQYLLSHGADADGFAKDGVVDYLNPLMMSSMNGHKKFVLMLLRAGANANLKTTRGLTAFDMAKRNNQTHITKYLQCAMELRKGETFKDKCE